MSLFKYEVFHKVVELGSLTRASEALGLTQSGVSHAVHSLETEFGFSILTRNRSGVRLTDNGERVLAFVREMLQVQERLKQEVAAINGLETGTIRIGTFTSISVQWLPGIIRDFLASHPRIEVNLYEGDYHEIEEWLLSGEIDFGFVSMPTLDSFEVIPLKLDRMLCILPRAIAWKKSPAYGTSTLPTSPSLCRRKAAITMFGGYCAKAGLNRRSSSGRPTIMRSWPWWRTDWASAFYRK